MLLLVLSSTTLLAQIAITGTVLDESGIELPGVTVLVKGTTTGVVTDMSGNYNINVPSNQSILVFSFIGFESQEEVVGNRSSISVTLQPSVRALQEVVVTGYGAQSKRDITGAVTTVETDDLLSIPATTFAQQLQGRAAGVRSGFQSRCGLSSSLYRSMGMLRVLSGFPKFGKRL